MILPHPIKTVNNFSSFALIACFSFGVFACASEAPLPKVVEVGDPAGVLYGDTLLLKLEEVTLAASQKNAWGEAQLIKFAAHSDYLVRVRAIKALGSESFRQLEKPHQVLLQAVNDEHWLVRSMAIKALAKVPDDKSRQRFSERLKIEDNERVQKYLREALQQPSPESAL